MLEQRASSPNGYVREAAVHELAQRTDGSELPYLLVRANDWVPAVRSAAIKALFARVSTAYAAHFASCAPLVLRLADEKTRGAASNASLVRAVRALLLAPESRSALLAGLDSPDPAAVRACFELARGCAEVEVLVERGLVSCDPIVKRRAAELAAGSLEQSRLEALLPDMEKSRFADVRRAALLARVRRFPAESEVTTVALQRALFDPAASIRELARHHLRKRGDGSFADRYRAALPSAIAIAGLGETGVASDAEAILPYEDHDSTRVRREVVRALVRLGAATPGLILRALDDRSAAVSRAARDALHRRTVIVASEELGAIALRSPHAHARRNAIAALGRAPMWASLAWLIEATRLEPEVARAQLVALLAKPGFISPHPVLREHVRAALASHEPFVGAALAARIAEELRRA